METERLVILVTQFLKHMQVMLTTITADSATKQVIHQHNNSYI